MAAGLLNEEGLGLADEYPEVSRAVRTLWSNLGNVAADQVSGLGSMAGPAVRAGGDLPALARALNCYFAVERWFHAAFLDARKQDGIDLVTGAYQVGVCVAFCVSSSPL